MNKEKLKNVWKIIKDTSSAVVIGFVTAIIGLFLSFMGRKNLRDNRDTEDRIRADTDKLRRNTEGLRGTSEELRDNNERLRKFIKGLKEDETEE